MSFRSIIIAAPDGTNPIEFTVDKIQVPDPYPTMTWEPMNQSFQMRKTATGPGRRVWKAIGNDENHLNLVMTLHLVYEDDMDLLSAFYRARPNVVLFSLDSGSTRYFGVFSDEGLVPIPYENNEDEETGNSYFDMAEVHLAVLKATTTNFQFPEPEEP